VQVSAGGSLANTLVGVARLSRAAGTDLRVALGGSLGIDTLGQYFNSQMHAAGVRCLLDTPHPPRGSHAHAEHPQPADVADATSLSPAAAGDHAAPAPGGHTGTVVVLTTQDAQRSFLSFFTNDGLHISDKLRSAIRSSRLVVVEGYLWGLDGAEEAITEVVRTARVSGAQVRRTARAGTP
jgi:sugar/nucleoside kinase (ribokinase family)